MNGEQLHPEQLDFFPIFRYHEWENPYKCDLMSLIRSAFTVASLTMVSRLVGFLRDMFIASRLGAGSLSDVFLVAFKLPNFFRHIFAEGAFNASFVPLFSGKLAVEGKEAAESFAEKVASVLFCSVMAVTILMQIFMPWVMYALAPGFTEDPAKFDLAVLLTRITFPYLAFMALVSLLGGVLNTFGRFSAAAFSPTLLNLCMIAAVVYFSKFTPTPAHSLSIGVTVAGVVQFLWLLASTRRAGIRLGIKLPKIDSEVKLLLKRMVPGVVGAGVTQLNLWIDTVIATIIPGAVSYLYYADRVNQFPLAVIGTAMSTALLPMLSRQVREGKQDEAVFTQNRALEMALLLSLPAATALVVIAVPVVSVLFERGAFHSGDTAATAKTLAVFACGLPAYVMIKVFAPCYFAYGDTKTPVRIAITCLIVNTCISLILIKPVGYVGLAFATVTSSWLNVFMLQRGLIKRKLFKVDERLRYRLPRFVFAAIAMGVVLWVASHYSMDYFVKRTIIKTAALTVLIGIGGTVFFFSAHILKAFNLKSAFRLARR